MGEEIRLTPQTIKVLRPFLDAPEQEIAGIDVLRASLLASGTAYPIMLRLERLGLLTSRWEESEPGKLGRPRRRYYSITPRGAAMARSATREFVGSFDLDPERA